jgi:hypothetical protein
MAQVIQHGKAQKIGSGNLQVFFDQPFSQLPTVVVSPFWSGKNQQVGFIETITSISTTDFTITSENHDTIYYVQWIAVAG